MKPDLNSVVQKLLQENANKTLAIAQLESLLEQAQKKAGE